MPNYHSAFTEIHMSEICHNNKYITETVVNTVNPKTVDESEIQAWLRIKARGQTILY